MSVVGARSFLTRTAPKRQPRGCQDERPPADFINVSDEEEVRGSACRAAVSTGAVTVCGCGISADTAGETASACANWRIAGSIEVTKPALVIAGALSNGAVWRG